MIDKEGHEYVYIMTTKDKYEFPIMIEDSLVELSRKSGVSKATIKSSIRRGAVGYKKIRIDE